MPDSFTDSSFELGGGDEMRAAEQDHIRHETVRLAKRLRGVHHPTTFPPPPPQTIIEGACHCRSILTKCTGRV
eukprot:4309310-Amphidinium_carterae.1